MLMTGKTEAAAELDREVEGAITQPPVRLRTPPLTKGSIAALAGEASSAEQRPSLAFSFSQ